MEDYYFNISKFKVEFSPTKGCWYSQQMAQETQDQILKDSKIVI